MTARHFHLSPADTPYHPPASCQGREGQGQERNRLLAALPTDDYGRLRGDMEKVTLSLGQVLYEPGARHEYIYFPGDAIVSLMFTTRDGASAELAMIGNDGMVGLPLILGGETAHYRAVVQSAGTACRICADTMQWEFAQGRALQSLLLRFTQALMSQIAQSVVCNRHHTVDQQLCRWLLLSLDRLQGSELRMTQELIANMLGVRREGVSEAACKLQRAGLINYRRGHITIVDRPGLEARTCECYDVVRGEYDRLFDRLASEPRVRTKLRLNPASLRRRAEDKLINHDDAHSSTGVADTAPEPDLRLKHELDVQRIELELQHDELMQAYHEADTLSRQYADIYDFAPLAYLSVSATGQITQLNLSAAILLNMKRSEAKGVQIQHALAPRSQIEFESFMHEVLTSGMNRSCQLSLVANPHRGEAIVRVEATPDEAGDECRIVMLDVTDQVLAERRLREREQYLRALIDNFPFMVWLKDEQSRFLATNIAFARHFGKSCDEMVGKSDYDITTPERARTYRAEDRAVLLSVKTKHVEEKVEKPEGARWFETYKSPVIVDGRHIGTVGFARDITERCEMQQAIQDSELRYRSFIEGLPLGAMVVQNGLVRYVNAAAVRLLGWPPQELVGTHCTDHIVESDQAQFSANHESRMASDDTAPNCYECRVVARDGRVFDGRWHVSTVVWDGAPAALKIFEDITEHKRMVCALETLASTDALTGLSSRRQCLISVDEALSQLKRNPARKAALLLLDLDDFKAINDTLGHSSGDSVLCCLAGLLHDELRKGDVAGRLGGDEFAVLLPDTTLETAGRFAERVRERFEKTSAESGSAATVSIGVTVLLAHDEGTTDALRRADEALYRAKASSRNRVETNDGADARDVANPGLPT